MFAFLTLWAFVVVLPTNIAGVGARALVTCTLLTLQILDKALCALLTLEVPCEQGNYVDQLTNNKPPASRFTYWISPPPPLLAPGQSAEPPGPEAEVLSPPQQGLQLSRTAARRCVLPVWHPSGRHPPAWGICRSPSSMMTCRPRRTACCGGSTPLACRRSRQWPLYWVHPSAHTSGATTRTTSPTALSSPTWTGWAFIVATADYRYSGTAICMYSFLVTMLSRLAAGQYGQHPAQERPGSGAHDQRLGHDPVGALGEHACAASCAAAAC